jgi:signal transduction histidine kinase
VVVHHGRAAVGASAGSFAALVDAGRTFQMLASEGYDDASVRAFERFPVTPGRPLSDAVLGAGPAYLASVDDARARYPAMAETFRSTGFEAYVALPVRAGDRPAAGLSFSFAERRAFDAEERAFLETLAAQAGQTLERAQLVEAERAALAQAEAASRAKSQFLATMSHELRTPLNAIGGHVQLVEMGLHGPLTPAQAEALGRVQRAQRHLLGLINDVLNYARLESGRVEYDLRPVAVRDVVADVLPLIEPQLATKGLALEVLLPDAEPPLLVRADAEKLRQVLLNLLSNAVKFTDAGGRVVVELTERGDGTAPADLVFLRVSDTGIGIPADQLETVFEPFVQVGRSYAQESGGTGLGLAISRDLARGMGGDLRARSVVGRGSSFTVALRRTE